MVKNKKNLIIIGCGKIAEIGHLPAIIKSNRANLIGLVDKNIYNAKRLTDLYSISCKIGKSVDEIKDKIDGAVIATPNFTHYAVGKQCLENGLHVLIEKPICIKKCEAINLCEIAEKNKLKISVGFVTRFYQNVILMKELIDENYFGKIIKFELEYGSVGGWESLSAYDIDREKSGGGVLVTTGSHLVERLVYWFGVPLKFEYYDDSYGGVEANCKIKVWFKKDNNEFIGKVFLSKTCKLKNKIFLETEKFFVEIKEGNTNSILLIPKNHKNIIYEVYKKETKESHNKNAFDKQIDNFIDCLEEIANPVVSGYEGLVIVELFENMYNSKIQLEEPWLIGL